MVKLKLIIFSLIAEFLKFYIDIRYLLRIPVVIVDKGNNIVVSLTTYGRRVNNIVPYTIYYLYRQRVKPQRVILWIDERTWNDKNLPEKLKFLQKHGLEINYCKDIKSYTKLIYSLRICPNNPIITIDDDMLYHSNMVKLLSESYNENPRSVSALVVSYPQWNKINESLMPYKKWPMKNVRVYALSVFAKGFGGVLYPPACFNEEVYREDIFTELCPDADDVWFWVMEILNGTQVLPIVNNLAIFPSDSLYQFLHKGAALNHSNVHNSGNDKQIEEVLKYYGLVSRKIAPPLLPCVNNILIIVGLCHLERRAA